MFLPFLLFALCAPAAAQTQNVQKVPSATANAGTLTDGFHVPTGKSVTFDTGSTLALGSATITGLVPPANLGTGSSITTKFLRGDGTWQTITPGTGTVTSVSVVSANGLSGTVATATTTPAITLSAPLLPVNFADNAARAAATPTARGQLALQLDNNKWHFASGTSAGQWSANLTVDAVNAYGSLSLFGATNGSTGFVADAEAGDGFKITLYSEENLMRFTMGTASFTVPAGVSGTLGTSAFVTLGSNVGAFLATPSGANLASALTTALPASKGGTGLTALGTGVATALGINTGTSGSFIVSSGAGTISGSAVTGGTFGAVAATNLTGTAASLTAGNVTTNANLTGHVTSTGNAAVLGSFTMAQLNTAVSDGDPAYVGASNTFTGTLQTIKNLELPLTTASTGTATAGAVFQGGSRWMHSFGGTGCVFIGIDSGSLAATNTGTFNFGLGGQALGNITSGGSNAALGYNALVTATTGSYNTGLGGSALKSLTTGQYNVAVGYNACGNGAMTGVGFNVALGAEAGLSLSGAASNNTLIGVDAGQSGTAITTGGNNTLLGANAQVTSATSSFRTALGSGAAASADNTITLGRSAGQDAVVFPAGSPPASASAAGVAGTITWDASFIYVCTATNTWKRVAIATW